MTLKLIIEKSLKFDDNLKKARHDTEVLKFCLGNAGEYTLTVHRTIANLTAFSDATSKSVLCTQAYEVVRSSEHYGTGEKLNQSLQKKAHGPQLTSGKVQALLQVAVHTTCSRGQIQLHHHNRVLR